MICKLQAEIRDLADSFLFMAEIVEPSRELEEALRDKGTGQRSERLPKNLLDA